MGVLEMKTVCVLMSTFNGICYIDEQIQSIISQKGIHTKLIIRDDGSNDGTVEYIKKNYPNIEVIEGENLGYKKSFHTLLNLAPEFEYYAFADQDDVWDKDKLLVAVNQIKDISVPAFYCSNLMLVNENMEEIGQLHKENENIRLDSASALVENLSYGCTLVFNNELRKIAQRKIPNYVSHDGWINLVGLHFGTGIYDSTPHISYRQHGKNVLGGERSFIMVWRKRLNSFGKLGEHHRDNEAMEFYETYKDKLEDFQIKNILEVANYRKNLHSKLKLFFDHKIKMSTLDRDFWYRVRILFSVI